MKNKVNQIPMYVPIIATVLFFIFLASSGVSSLSSESGGAVIAFWALWFIYNERIGFIWEFKNNKIFWATQFVGDPLLLILMFKGFVGAFIVGCVIYLPLFIYGSIGYKSYK